MKRICFVMLVASLLCGGLLSVSKTYSDVTLSSRYMGQLEGNLEAWWGSDCSCYYWGECDTCLVYADRGANPPWYDASKCTTSQSTAHVEGASAMSLTADCDDFSVDCGSFYSCFDEDCTDCSEEGTCAGCYVPTSGSDAC
jgi:hypothetical protein